MLLPFAPKCFFHPWLFFLLYPRCLSCLCFLISPSLFHTQLRLSPLFHTCFFPQFFPSGGQPKPTRCWRNVDEWEGLHGGAENLAGHLSKRVFERILLLPVWMRISLLNIGKCYIHPLKASLFQSDGGWWEVLSGRRMAPGHVSRLLYLPCPRGGSTQLEMTQLRLILL